MAANKAIMTTVTIRTVSLVSVNVAFTSSSVVTKLEKNE